jgi:hypothetical protein
MTIVAEQMRTEAEELRFLRWVAGYTLLDRRRSKEIRRKVKERSICEETEI